MTKKPPGPVKLGNLLAGFLASKGIADRIEPLRVLEEWPVAVGPTVAAVTRALQLDKEGTLIVDVRTHAWMQELRSEEHTSELSHGGISRMPSSA